MPGLGRCLSLLAAALVSLIPTPSLAQSTAAAAPTSTTASTTTVTSAFVDGGGGLPIAYSRWGRADAPGLLLIHGSGFSKEFWQPQQVARLGDRFNVVAMDIRGHGESGKPNLPADLIRTSLYADDVQAVIRASGLRNPIIVGWSYGGYVVMDYVRHYGTGSIAGIVFAGSTGGLAERLHPDPPPPGYAQYAPLQSSASMDERRQSADYMARLMSVRTLDAATLRSWQDAQLAMPAYVRRNLAGRPLDNKDLQAKLDIPVTFVIGAKDQTMPQSELARIARELPRGSLRVMPDAGHAVSFDAAAAFNDLLLSFAASKASSASR